MSKLYTFYRYDNNGLVESFDTNDLEKCLTEGRDKDRFQTCYVKCNFDPKLGSLMECFISDDFYSNVGKLTLTLTDGGDGGSTDLDSLIAFLVKAFPEKIDAAQGFPAEKIMEHFDKQMDRLDSLNNLVDKIAEDMGVSFSKVQQPTLDEMA